MISKLSLWIEAMRPKTLAASIAPVLIGLFLSFPHISLITACVTLLSALSIQIGTNLANDYFDGMKGADSSQRIGPRRMTQSGLIDPQSMKIAIFITFSITTCLSTYLIMIGGPIIAFLAAVSIILGLAYTTGPYPLAYLGLGDLFVLIFFGPIATATTHFLQVHQWSTQAIVLGLSPGLLSMAILTVNHLRDIQEDAKHQKKTLAVRFGQRFGQIEYTISIIIAISIPCFFGYYLPLLTIIPATTPLKTIWKKTHGTLLNLTLEQTGKLLLFFSILLSFNTQFL